MSQKQIGKNTGDSGRVNLSGPELEKFKANVGDPIKVDIAESKEIAQAMVENAECSEFVIVSKPTESEGTDE